ncbi:DUF2750 domain-containing protein [Alteromonas aestuariivivens]|uniref:DUF2750 domain-containing protein n=1 Tax=Alteromonas aestuariivivens TaxID=1938339 RepID=A0A3D8M4C0_9ALTE|nr:DUF2750 domain-containing protein [Alteromonas aestuariivivens]RDV24458.1 DUF2750 domain-containing protein [Alteromonas aestuariivivens]
MTSISHPLLAVSPQNRAQQTVEMIASGAQIWILTDNDGCVMLTSEDEDGVPVWPDEALARLWATDDWADCQPMAISLDKWMSKWTPGLMQDALVIMVCPVPGEEGEVMAPEDFAAALQKA